MLEDFDTGASRPKRVPGPRALAPWLSGAVLLAVLVVSVVTRPPVRDTSAYFALVADRVRGVPYTVDAWVGQDAEVVAAARELLKPNAILQRRYSRLDDGMWFDVIVVHCGDVRDMQGHYPPVCYPSAGWQIDAGTPVVAGIGAHGVPATEYVVTWPHDRGVQPVRIVNFFALPSDGAQYARDMGALEQAAHARATAELGVLQIQVLTPVAMDSQVRDALMPDVWGVLEPVVRAVVGGPDADR